MSEGPEWFAPKRYGYGAGLPISWQGWALTIGYALLVLFLSVALKDRPSALVAALVPPTVAFLVICARTTRGGWRWRWGGDD
jgi:lipopolysaccharide export LptBFGC system permease protein LptF